MHPAVAKLTVFGTPTQYLITRNFSYLKRSHFLWSVPSQSNPAIYARTSEIGRGPRRSGRPIRPPSIGAVPKGCVTGRRANTVRVDGPDTVAISCAVGHVGVRVRSCIAAGVVDVNHIEVVATIGKRYPRRPRYFNAQYLVARHGSFRGLPVQIDSPAVLAPHGRQTSWGAQFGGGRPRRHGRSRNAGHRLRVAPIVPVGHS